MPIKDRGIFGAAITGFQGNEQSVTVPDVELLDLTLEDPIYPTLTEERQKELIGVLMEEVEHTLHERSDLKERMEQYYAMWRGITERKSSPWKESSNVAVRLIFDDVQRVHAKYVDTFLNQESFMFIRGEEEGDVPKARVLDQYMEYKMRDRIKAYFPLSEAMQLATLYGTAFVKVFWERDERLIRERVKEPVVVPIIDPDTGEPVINPETGEVFTQETGELEDVIVERTEIKYDDPKIETIPNLLDVIWPIDSDDPQTARWIIHRKRISLDDLRRKAIQGVYSKDAVEQLTLADFNNREFADVTREEDELDELQLQAQGFDTDTEELDQFQRSRKMVTIYEVFMKYPIESDNSLEEECVFTFVPGTNFLLRGHPNMSKDGSRAIHRLRHVRVPGEMQGIGICELLFDYNDIVNTSFNMAFDNAHISMLPVFRMSENARAQNQDASIYPGKIITGEAGEFEKLQLGGANPQLIQLMQFVEQLSSKVTGVTDLARGIAEENRPVARVTAIRNAQSAGFFRVQTRFMGQDLTQVYKSIVALYQQFGDDELVLRVVDPEDPQNYGFKTISREEIRFNPDIRIKAIDLEKQLLKENRRDLFPMMLQMSQIPIEQQQTISGVNLREAFKQLLKDFEYEEVGKIILSQEQVSQEREQQQAVVREQMAQAAAAQVSQGVNDVGAGLSQQLAGLQDLQQAGQQAQQ